jgi:hypothetical protein
LHARPFFNLGWQSLTRRQSIAEAWRVIEIKPERPYFEAWLKRARRHFAASGVLSQSAVLLSAKCGGSTEEWRARLDAVLNGGEVPTLDLLTQIDAVLAKPATRYDGNPAQELLFPMGE